MKLICILLACLSFFTPAYAIDQSKLDAFKAEVEKAIQAKDIVALNKCFYWADTPQALIDQTIFGYQCNMKQYKYQGYHFSGIG